MSANRAITIKFVTFRSTFVYDCTALVPLGIPTITPRFFGSTGYVQRTIGEVAA
jgi:hypothetical protein